jgi:hypothetical protein
MYFAEIDVLAHENKNESFYHYHYYEDDAKFTIYDGKARRFLYAST